MGRQPIIKCPPKQFSPKKVTKLLLRTGHLPRACGSLGSPGSPAGGSPEHLQVVT